MKSLIEAGKYRYLFKRYVLYSDAATTSRQIDYRMASKLMIHHLKPELMKKCNLITQDTGVIMNQVLRHSRTEV
jgi:hypothetical protein